MTGTTYIKTYFATSVKAAIELARLELGEDAMLLNSRQAPEDARHLGQYEVVFATELSARGQEQDIPASASLQPAASSSASAEPRLLLERAHIEPEVLHRLLASEKPGDQARDIRARMEQLLSIEPVLAKSSNHCQIAAFAGPPGRGKTTTLVKLAVSHGIASRIPVRIFSADYLRIAAADQLRTLAAILGVAFQAFPSIAALDHALRQPFPGLTLIDTPGFSPRDSAAAGDLARCLQAHPHLETHLVLRADTQAAELAAAAVRFEPFRPKRLIFTGVDEAATFGAVYSAAVQTRIPISFLGNGQSIPEDLEAASAGRIVALVLGAAVSFGSAAA
ncbi:MAG: hypothetical protein M3Z09_07190 [Acidobacteriota bacterium]|nr:hypothetical protein [Acidobacteriota bacterium]